MSVVKLEVSVLKTNIHGRKMLKTLWHLKHSFEALLQKLQGLMLRLLPSKECLLSTK